MQMFSSKLYVKVDLRDVDEHANHPLSCNFFLLLFFFSSRYSHIFFPFFFLPFNYLSGMYAAL